MRVDLDRDGLIEAVALRALDYPYRIWGFGEGMALLGLLRAGLRLDRPKWIDAVADLVAPSLAEAPSPLDHLIPVDVLTELAQLRPLPVAEAIGRFRSAIGQAIRPVPGRPRVHRHDLPGLSTMIWVDCLHTDAPGLPGPAGTALVDEACAVLQDGTGLFSHGYDVATGRANGVHWGRGQGWALHGLQALPARRDRLRTALRRYQVDGAWRTIVDDPAAPIEFSLSALVAAADGRRTFYRGVRGYDDTGDDPVWTDLRRRAFAVAVAALDGEGGLPVSAATPVGPAVDYLTRATGVYPWGQGPLLLALLCTEL